jgi:hypothetical protein
MMTAKGNDTNQEINRRIIMTNICFNWFNKLMKSKSIPNSEKLTIYKSFIMPVIMYSSETCTMSETNENQLGNFERKILQVIFGPICVNGVCQRRYSSEVYELLPEADNVEKKIKFSIQMVGSPHKNRTTRSS